MQASSWKPIAVGAIGVAASLAIFVAARSRAAGIPDADVMTYTGYLEGADGQPLTGEHSIAVSFWESEEATSDLCTGSLNSVELQSGRFQVPLPDECTDAVKANTNLFVDVLVDGASLGRTKLGAVPFAVEAGHATSANEAAAADAAASATGALAEELASKLTASSVQGGSIDPPGGPPVGAKFEWQAGSTVAISDAQGHLPVTFPKAFTGLQSVIATTASGDLYGVAVPITGQSKTGFIVGMAANVTIRVNWIAVGW